MAGPTILKEVSSAPGMVEDLDWDFRWFASVSSWAILMGRWEQVKNYEQYHGRIWCIENYLFGGGYFFMSRPNFIFLLLMPR